MRDYMPGSHRRFLQDVEAVANIRSYVDDRRTGFALQFAYDTCLSMLREMRDQHIQVVCRYIVVQSRVNQQAPPSGTHPMVIDSATMVPGDRKILRGTGGTALIPFLKQARDETAEPVIDARARRLLSHKPGSLEPASLNKVGEQPDDHPQLVDPCGKWTAGHSEGGICRW
ncbi:Indoleamine 2-3-dioxygenase [Penicillium diatomitis]|uniref:Indoleamine 2,3-dioxygenase n=1 Tax=Penicillium diatomitis TaxID=2819901 RepID=A0A9W9WRD9_9EURO|nr:Indoleamine 2-3-dioxygenase [Penicillium diatomitis]KAJ5472121.1 Indoleamine 2-3-dioxygenase [Penicillium diatomitis]